MGPSQLGLKGQENAEPGKASAGYARRLAAGWWSLPVGDRAGHVAVARGERAGHVERANSGEGISTDRVGPGRGTGGSRLHELPAADDLGLRTGNGVAGEVAVHVLEGAHALLDVTDVHDTSGAIRTSLPGASADEENADKRKKDEDNDRQLNEGHPGLLGVLGVCQCHGFVVCFG